MKFNIFKREAGGIEDGLNINKQEQAEIAEKREKLKRAEQNLSLAESQTLDKEAELEGEKITTELASQDFEREQAEKESQIAKLKLDLEAKIQELEVLGLNAEPLRQALEKIEGALSFEWGPELGQMSWTEALEKISELNKTLKEGETLWRLPAKEEWLEVIEPFTEAYSKGTSSEELSKILEEIRQKYNLQPDFYWSSNTRAGGSDYAWFVNMHYGTVDHGGKNTKFFVRCIK